jgi:hypothetical protein
MRLFLVGLMGAFMLTFAPVVPEAQGQSRTSAQNHRPAAAADARTTPTRRATPAQSANRPAARSAARPAATARTAPQRPAARNAARASAAVPYSNRRAATPAADSRQTAALRCTTRNGRRVCSPRADAPYRWAGDLAPAAMIQRACPEGTMATNAIGHSDITRCVPL